jgi:hypothetical protein
VLSFSLIRGLLFETNRRSFSEMNERGPILHRGTPLSKLTGIVTRIITSCLSCTSYFRRGTSSSSFAFVYPRPVSITFKTPDSLRVVTTQSTNFSHLSAISNLLPSTKTYWPHLFVCVHRICAHSLSTIDASHSIKHLS